MGEEGVIETGFRKHMIQQRAEESFQNKQYKKKQDYIKEDTVRMIEKKETGEEAKRNTMKR